MGISDPKGKDMICRAELICDLLNGSLCGGRQYFQPENIERLPEAQHIIYRDGDGKEKYEEQTPDAVYCYHDGEEEVYLTIQNQKNASLVMPVRENLSAAILYKRQTERRRRELKKKDLKEGVEFLSGVKETDLFSPVICTVLYYGEKPWTGAEHLHGMLKFPDGFPEAKALCPDYKINLIHCGNVNPKHFKTGFRQLFELLPYAADKRELAEYVNRHPSHFDHLDDETCDLLEAFMGFHVLDEKNRKKYKKQGGYDMCTALVDLRNDGVEEGLARGLSLGREEASNAIFTLVAYMQGSEEDAPKIHLLKDDVELRREMMEKYGIEF